MKYLILVNPSSNGGRALKKWREYAALVPECKAVILENIEQARELAENASGFDAIVACGGDGTVNAVANGVMTNPDTDLKFGVLYAGTSPDFCLFHHIPVETTAAAACLERGNVREIEVLQANGNYFFCSCNTGMGANVAAIANRMRPMLGNRPGTFFALLWNILKAKKYNYTVNGELIANCNHLLITRMPYIAGGLKLNLPEMQAGQYAVWYLQDISLCGWLKLLPSLYQGKAAGKVKICSEHIMVSASEPVRVEYDGDPHGTLPLKINLAERKLKLITEQ